MSKINEIEKARLIPGGYSISTKDGRTIETPYIDALKSRILADFMKEEAQALLPYAIAAQAWLDVILKVEPIEDGALRVSYQGGACYELPSEAWYMKEMAANAGEKFEHLKAEYHDRKEAEVFMLRQTVADLLAYAQEPGEGDDQDDYRRVIAEARSALARTSKA